MNRIPRIRRVTGILAGLAGGLLAVAAAPAALAARTAIGAGPPFLGPNRAGHPPVPVQIHTVVTGGMPGWQIILIAAGAALLAATAAVFLDRARTARRHVTTTAA